LEVAATMAAEFSKTLAALVADQLTKRLRATITLPTASKLIQAYSCLSEVNFHTLQSFELQRRSPLKAIKKQSGLTRFTSNRFFIAWKLLSAAIPRGSLRF